MTAQSVKTLVDQLHGAGLKLALAPAGGLAVAPASSLTDELRVLIRNGKAELIDWLSAGNDVAPAPPANPRDWHELAAAYYTHHFTCDWCIAAGQGAQYGLRCGVGAALWRQYCA